MKALIIDDERLARAELRALLSAHSQIEICAEAANPREAVALVAQHRPDVLFLDIRMPGASGFDLLEMLQPPHPQVIFITAYHEHAVRAFEVNALDYLTKPIHPQRLAAAIARLHPPAGPAAGPVATGGTSSVPWRDDDRVFLREGDLCWFVAVKTIHLLEAEGSYTRIHFDKHRPLLYRTLSALEERLPPRQFLRANRSQLVNQTFIAAVEPWFSGSLKMRLTTGDEVEFSRRQAQLFRDRLGL